MRKLNHVEMKDIMMTVHSGLVFWRDGALECSIGVTKDGMLYPAPARITPVDYRGLDLKLVSVRVPAPENTNNIFYTYTSEFADTVGKQLLEAVNKEIDEMNIEMPQREKGEFLRHMLLALSDLGFDLVNSIDCKNLDSLEKIDLFYESDEGISLMTVQVKDQSIKEITDDILDNLPDVRMINEVYPMFENIIKTTAGFYVEE